MFSFDISKVNDKQKLGAGGFGMIFPYQKHKNDPKDDKWVVKIMTTKKIEEFIKFHVQEITLGFSFDHPNVMPIRGFYIDYDANKESWYTYLKLPRMVESLDSKIKTQQIKKEYFPGEKIAKYFYELTSGLQYLHNRGIAHCDLKPANILIDKHDHLKIGDIGIGRFVGDETSLTLNEYAGTKSYSAPEILQKTQMKKRDLFKSDIWSLGVTVLELCLLELKILDCSKALNKDEIQLQLEKKLNRLDKIGEKGYPELKNIISSLLQYNPSERKSLDNIQKMLEEKFPFLLEKHKKINEETQTEFNFELKPLVKKLDKHIQFDLEAQQKFNLISKEFHEKWTKYFNIKIEYQEYAKITTVKKDLTDEMLKKLIEELIQLQQTTNNHEIKQLDLDFSAPLFSKITDNSVKEVALLVESNFKNIEQLSLQFYQKQMVKYAEELIEPNLNKIKPSFLRKRFK